MVYAVTVGVKPKEKFYRESIVKHTLLWLDLEMTGLSPDRDIILQCAAAVTNNELAVVAEGAEYVIGWTSAQLEHMDAVVRAMHTNSGLLERVQQSTHLLAEVEQALITFFNTHCEPYKTLLCGNSIWVDRAFLKRHMPRFEALLHYRMIDVSTVKELTLRWYPDLAPFEKKKQHTALADLYESIDELLYYKHHIFV